MKWSLEVLHEHEKQDGVHEAEEVEDDFEGRLHKPIGSIMST